jgi:hypothetical protein
LARLRLLHDRRRCRRHDGLAADAAQLSVADFPVTHRTFDASGQVDIHRLVCLFP